MKQTPFLLAALLGLALIPSALGTAGAEDDTPSLSELGRRLDALAAENARLRARLARLEAGPADDARPPRPDAARQGRRQPDLARPGSARTGGVEQRLARIERMLQQLLRQGPGLGPQGRHAHAGDRAHRGHPGQRGPRGHGAPVRRGPGGPLPGQGPVIR